MNTRTLNVTITKEVEEIKMHYYNYIFILRMHVFGTVLIEYCNSCDYL